MNLNPKIEQLADAKPNFLMDHESVAKDKCYKLGIWLHGEHRCKSKRASSPAESISKREVAQEETEKKETPASNNRTTVKTPLRAGRPYEAASKVVVHKPCFPIKQPIYTLLANG